MDLTDVVGGFGPWQRTILLVIIYRAIPLSFIGTVPLFFVATTDHWCARPDNLRWTAEQWKEEALPEKEGTCRQFEAFLDAEGQLVVDTNRTLSCEAWEYTDEYGNTLVKEFNLVCGDAWKASLTHTAIKIGNMVAFLPGGYLTDRFGRKRVVLWGTAVCLILSTVAAFSPSYNFYLVMRVLIGFTYGIIVTGSICLLLEVLGPNQRHKVSYSFIGGWGIGMMLVPGLYWLDQDWRHSQLITSIPFIIALMISIWWFVPESTRWLLTTNQDEKAGDIIMSAAKKNGVIIVDKDAIMRDLKQKIIQDAVGEGKRASYLDLFRTQHLRKCTIVLYVSYFLTAFVYFGFTLTVQALGASLYLTVFLMGITEVLAVGLYVPLSLYVRRRPSLLILCLVSAACYLAAIPVPKDMTWLRLTLAMAGRLANINVYQLMWVVTAEIYPTTHRTVGLNGCMTLGRLGSVFATFLVSVAQASNSSFLLVIFGVLVGLCGLLYLLLPETKDNHLPDTLGAADNLAQKKLEKTASKNESV